MLGVIRTSAEARNWMRFIDVPKPNQPTLSSRIAALGPCASENKKQECRAEAPCRCRRPGGEDLAGGEACTWKGHESILDLIALAQQHSYVLALSEAVGAISGSTSILERRGIGAALGAVWNLIDGFASSQKLERFRRD